MTAHYERRFWLGEGTVCAACRDWWPCETVAPRDPDDVPLPASATAGDSDAR